MYMHDLIKSIFNDNLNHYSEKVEWNILLFIQDVGEKCHFL